jgi:hypothetical protein
LGPGGIGYIPTNESQYAALANHNFTGIESQINGLCQRISRTLRRTPNSWKISNKGSKNDEQNKEMEYRGHDSTFARLGEIGYNRNATKDRRYRY